MDVLSIQARSEKMTEKKGKESKVSEKVMHFQARNKDLSQLSQQIVQQLSKEGYVIQSATAPLGTIIQAQKIRILHDLLIEFSDSPVITPKSPGEPHTDKAFTIVLTGQPNDFSIHIGVGKWILNISAAKPEAILFTGLFLPVNVSEKLWVQHVEKGIMKDITQLMG